MDKSGAATNKTSGLVLDNVHCGYGPVPVLKGISLNAAQGERIAILGPNGVGKTTLMHTIIGLVKPQSGRLRWNDRNLGVMKPHECVGLGIAIVPEGRRLYGGMTAAENLQMGAFALPRQEAARRIEELYDCFPLLRERRSQLAATMSGGQQQVCAIARALISRPKLLLIDELTLGLSPAAIADVLDAVRLALELLSPTLIIVDQDIKIASALASRGYFLDLGRIVAEGTLQDLLSADLVKSLYLDSAADAALAH